MRRLIRAIATQIKRARCEHAIGRRRKVGKHYVVTCIGCGKKWIEIQNECVPLPDSVDPNNLARPNRLLLLRRRCDPIRQGEFACQ